jgi:hypothetical protein
VAISFRPHLQLRGQFWTFTRFPIKPCGANRSIGTLLRMYKIVEQLTVIILKDKKNFGNKKMKVSWNSRYVKIPPMAGDKETIQ